MAELVGAGGLTWQLSAISTQLSGFAESGSLTADCCLQLRDSAGLKPASPLGLPIRGRGTLTIIQLCWYCTHTSPKRQLRAIDL
jgi:hypothetical protein